METQNFTLRLPKELIRKARILAAQRGTSVSALLTESIGGLVEHDLERDGCFLGPAVTPRISFRHLYTRPPGHTGRTWCRPSA